MVMYKKNVNNSLSNYKKNEFLNKIKYIAKNNPITKFGKLSGGKDNLNHTVSSNNGLSNNTIEKIKKLKNNKKLLINEQVKLLENKEKLISNKKLLINEEINLLSQEGSSYPNFDHKKELINIEKSKVNNKLEILHKKTDEINEKIYSLGGIKKDGVGILQKIKNIFKSDFFIFIKNYLYFIILFTIIFYIFLHINNNTKNSMVIIETKIFFYISIIILFIIFNDILETPVESINKILYITIFTLIIIYIICYLIEHYYGAKGFFNKLKLISLCVFIFYIIMLIFVYFVIKIQDQNIAVGLFNSFNYGVRNNISFLVFLTIYLYAYYATFRSLNKNSKLTTILESFSLGSMLVFFIFCLIIYIAIKLKIISNMQILNTFIVLFSIATFLIFVCMYIFMESLNKICTTNQPVENINEREYVSIIMIVCIFIILWLDDTRNWKQTGSIIFIIVTLITIYCMFYYSVSHPSTATLSLWLFIEWLIIIFYKKENSKNSIHYSFMKV